MNETIAAIATGAGGGIGIVRISGPDALGVAVRVFRGRGGRSLEAAPPMALLLGAVLDPVSGDTIDEAFAVHMRPGRSYTGEATVEIQCHGGRGVMDDVLRAVLHAGARPAEPGEFTKRSFLSGRIDLSQAEAVAELVAARTEGARRSALSRLQGALGQRVRSLRARLLDQVAAAEAILDHGDEEMAGPEPNGGEISALAAELRELLAAGESREARDGGPRVVIAGRVNSGKSSLFNKLCDSDRSIVSPAPGTTRDYVEECSTLGGGLVTLVDTAGLREVPDEIESEGIRRSRLQMLGADLLIMVLDCSLPLEPDDLRLLDEFRDRSPLVVLSKADLPAQIDRSWLEERYPGLRFLPLSALGGQGCPDLVRAIADRCRDAEDGGEAPPSNHRQREALRSAAHALEEAGRLLAEGMPLDMAVAELRLALAAVGEITGETAGEEVLDRIFSRFCLGK